MEIRPIIRKVLRADGTEEELQGPLSSSEIELLIGAKELCVVMLVDRHHVMLVDDMGNQKGLPVNDAATTRYLSQCRPGSTQTIVGDAVIVPETDFPLT